jgi:hypothetical protein
MVGVWLIGGFGLHLTLAGLRTDLLHWSIFIWLASGLIGALALAPGCLWPKPSEADRHPSELLVGVIASMGIRFVGTVALFGLCRYHDGLSAEATATFVCGWYALLTGVEVAALAKGMPGSELFTNKPAATDLSVVPTGGSQTSVTE